jgi:NAD(P)H-hydrate repair Nnr-like enzyme with NAD(P)H-hydrate dehydratase domain
VVVTFPACRGHRHVLQEPERQTADRDEADVAAAIATRFDAVVTYSSQVAAPDGRRWAVPTGHAGLGTSGSGDVLAGAVVGLLARGADPAQAACWATYLHATAGDRLAARVGWLGFLASELVVELPLVLVEAEA